MDESGWKIGFLTDFHPLSSISSTFKHCHPFSLDESGRNGWKWIKISEKFKWKRAWIWFCAGKQKIFRVVQFSIWREDWLQRRRLMHPPIGLDPRQATLDIWERDSSDILWSWLSRHHLYHCPWHSGQNQHCKYQSFKFVCHIKIYRDLPSFELNLQHFKIDLL